MKLIGADALKEYCMNASKSDDDFRRVSLATLASVIDAQPTAYDVDKVVGQLEDYGNEEMCYYKNTPYEKCIEECINKAIEIVRGGGVDAKTDFIQYRDGSGDSGRTEDLHQTCDKATTKIRAMLYIWR